MSYTKFKNEKGISLLFVVLITSVILAVGMGISGILVQQTKMMREIGYSVISFYAADSGVERQLYDLYKTSAEEQHHSQYTGNVMGDILSASYEVSAICGVNVIPADCPQGLTIALSEEECDAINICIKSTGNYKEIKRAIEIKY